jgi:hypothetical protein
VRSPRDVCTKLNTVTTTMAPRSQGTKHAAKDPRLAILDVMLGISGVEGSFGALVAEMDNHGATRLARRGRSL